MIEKHYGVDVSTRPEGSASSKPMDYKAGVYGKVTRAGGGDYNTITVKLADGTQIQYLHSSKVYVKNGQEVTPDTILGKSGDVGAEPGAVHVHVQARDAGGKIMRNPDVAFSSGLSAPRNQTAATTPQGRAAVGGVVVNPAPVREGSRIGDQAADRVLRKRPRSGSPAWRIELPAKGADGGGKND